MRTLRDYELTIWEHGCPYRIQVDVRAENLRALYRALCKEYGRLYCRTGNNGYENEDVIIHVYSKAIYHPMRTRV